MKVIGAGFGRTGTLSIKYALEELGFDPCYHMRDVIFNNHAALWEKIADGQRPSWDTILGRYQAGVDFPVSLYYEDLMDTYPDAKMLLSVRDAERWYESVAESIYQTSTLPRWMEWLPRLGPFLRMTRKTIWAGFFQGRFKDRASAIRLHEQHNADVQQIVPDDKLLVFNVKDGWEPLCSFLQLPIPDKPFPHVNERAEMQAILHSLRFVSRAIPVSIVALTAVLGWKLIKRINA